MNDEHTITLTKLQAEEVLHCVAALRGSELLSYEDPDAFAEIQRATITTTPEPQIRAGVCALAWIAEGLTELAWADEAEERAFALRPAGFKGGGIGYQKSMLSAARKLAVWA